MTTLDKVNENFGLLGTTISCMGRWRVWRIIVTLFLGYGLLLYIQFHSLSPVLYGAIEAWNRLLTSLFGWAGLSESVLSAFTHYPAHLALLGSYFGWSKLVFGILFEGLVFGLAAGAFARLYFGSRSDDFTSGRVISRWPQLLLGWLLINTILFLIGFLLPGLFEPLLDGPRRLLAFRFAVLPGSYLLVFAMFYFLFPLVALYRRNFLRATGDSLRLFARRPFTCLFLSTVIMSAPVLFSAALSYASLLVQRFDPEIVLWLLGAGLVAEMFAMFFWMGTSVRFLADHYR